jgi:hypothetical protein
VGASAAAQARAFDGFTKTYGCKSLVSYETHAIMTEAIRREKQIKRWRRRWKLKLIEGQNPKWRDLSEGWFEVAVRPRSVAPSMNLRTSGSTRDALGCSA